MDDFNPSGFLFPLARISATSTAVIEEVMEKLALIYSKGDDAQLVSGRHGKAFTADGSLARLDTSLRVNRRRKRMKEVVVIDSGYASVEDYDDGGNEDNTGVNLTERLELLRHNPMEREFTIRWLTGFVSRSSSWSIPTDQELSDEEIEEREALVEKAASLLSACANPIEGTDEALKREFTFPLGPCDNEETIHVELHDLLAPEDHSSVGLQSWASSIHFARMLAKDPADFGIQSDTPMRILELGAGTGMLSIATAKIIDGLRASFPSEIIATDYHADVLANLQRNIDSNFASDTLSSVVVYPFDWQEPSWDPPLDAPFDIILAADVVYDPCHAGWIKSCVSRLLKKPSPSCPDGGVYWMIIALRNIGRHAGLAAAVFDVFPPLDSNTQSGSGELSLKAVQVLDLEKSDGLGRRDESGYRLFKICWKADSNMRGQHYSFPAVASL